MRIPLNQIVKIHLCMIFDDSLSKYQAALAGESDHPSSDNKMF